MRNTILSAASILVLSAASAFAMVEKGPISDIELSDGTFSIAGHKYQLEERLGVDPLRDVSEGDEVRVVWDREEGSREVWVFEPTDDEANSSELAESEGSFESSDGEAVRIDGTDYVVVEDTGGTDINELEEGDTVLVVYRVVDGDNVTRYIHKR